MKTHPVFYVSFLQPAPQSTIPGRAFPEPPPILVDNEEEFEVENIPDSHIYRGRLQYLVEWKGYPTLRTPGRCRTMYAMRWTWFDFFTSNTLKLQLWHLAVPGDVDLEGGDVMHTAHRHAVA